MKEHRAAGRAQAVFVNKRAGKHFAHVALDAGAVIAFRRYRLTDASFRRLTRLCIEHRFAGGNSHLTNHGPVIYWRF